MKPSLTSFIKINLMILIIAMQNFSCQKENLKSEIISDSKKQTATVKSLNEEKSNIFKGPQVQFGNGHVRSWIKLSHSEKPLEIGVEFTSTALTGLPEHGHMYHTYIPLHKKAKDATPYDHVSMMWNPEGHPPANTFNLPHFDAHFMRITNEERMAIPEPGSTGSAFHVLPSPDYIPQGYIPSGGVAQMGRHWIAPPLPQPGMFTSVMVYGSYNGKMIFEEPMVTMQHMLNGGASNIHFGQPQLFHTPGYYPTKYNVYRSADGHYHISMSGFILRP